MTVAVIEPHGFCMGVRTALDKALHALRVRTPGEDAPVYCLHELVHNETIVSDLASRGMCFVHDLAEVPDGATVLFSAHGVAPEVRAVAAARGMQVIDATCPFVARVHRQVCAYAARGLAVVVIGRAAHAEVQGVAGEARAAGARVAVVGSVGDVAQIPFAVEDPIGVVCQTTLAADDVRTILAALRARWPRLETSPSADVCTATRDRQDAVRTFVQGATGRVGVLVLGSVASSNTGRLVELAEQAGARAFRAVDAQELAALDFAELDRLGVTSGASTPETFFGETIAKLTQLAKTEVTHS